MPPPDADRDRERERDDFVCLTLVDPRGWFLMQERDEHAPVRSEEHTSELQSH